MSFRLTWRIVPSFRLCQPLFLVMSIWSKWSSDSGMDIIKDFYNWQCLARSWLPNSLLYISRLNVFICCCRAIPHPSLALCPIGVSLTLRTASPGFLCCFLIGLSQCEVSVGIRVSNWWTLELSRREKLDVYSSSYHWTTPSLPFFPQGSSGFLSSLPPLLVPLTLPTPL